MNIHSNMCSIKCWLQIFNGISIALKIFALLSIGFLLFLLASVKTPCTCILALNETEFSTSLVQPEKYRGQCEEWLNSGEKQDPTIRFMFLNMCTFSRAKDDGFDPFAKPYQLRAAPLPATARIFSWCLIAQYWYLGFAIVTIILIMFATLVCSCFGTCTQTQWAWQCPSICCMSLLALLGVGGTILGLRRGAFADDFGFWANSAYTTFQVLHIILMMALVVTLCRNAHRERYEEVDSDRQQPTPQRSEDSSDEE